MLDHISAIVPVAKERRRIDLADSQDEEKVVSRFVTADELADYSHFLAAIDFRGGMKEFEVDPDGLRVSWEDWAKRIEETPSLQEMPEPAPPEPEKKEEEAKEDEEEDDEAEEEDEEEDDDDEEEEEE